ncbi:MAG: phosphotransferase [Alphaproteobacteria bacterium]|nr:phosphotransferase [Alphaproteobacteria bacterium]
MVRIGDTVRRATQRDTSLQRALLDHLQAKGFVHAPRFLGHDDTGRDILTYLPGEVLFDKDDFSDAQLAGAARLLRRFHDCTADFPPVRDAGAEIMCHNDWTPANTVFVKDVPFGMIDFDTIMPGTRLWDLTYSAWTWLGLSEERWSPHDQLRRLELFVAAYDHPSCTPALVAACLPARQAGRAHWATQQGRSAGADWANACLAWTLSNITNHYHPDGLP